MQSRNDLSSNVTFKDFQNRLNEETSIRRGGRVNIIMTLVFWVRERNTDKQFNSQKKKKTHRYIFLYKPNLVYPDNS